MQGAQPPHSPFGSVVPPSSAKPGVSDLDPTGAQPDASGDLGPWTLLWGGLALACALFFHGPVLILVALGLCGTAGVAALLSRRRFRAGTPQSRGLALLGVCLSLVALALIVVTLAGHPLAEWGWAWRFH